MCLSAKEFWKSVNIWGRYAHEFSVFCFFDSRCTYQTVTSVISVHFCCTGVWESLRKHLSEMYAVRFTQFSSSVASAAGAVVQRQTVMLGRCPVKLSANKVACLRSFASESGSRASTLRRVKSSSLKEKLLAPAGDSGLQHVLKYTHTAVKRPFVLDYLGEPVPER